MIQEEYISLIKTLLEVTVEGIVKWEKGDSYFSYSCLPTQKEKFVIDKYYSITDESKGSCVSLALFKENNEILDEVVCCNLAEEDAESFKLLNDLYNKVEEQYNKTNSERISPLLNDLNESLQRKIRHTNNIF